MVTLIEPVMAITLVSAIASPFVAFAFGIEASFSLHYASTLLGITISGVFALPLSAALMFWFAVGIRGLTRKRRWPGWKPKE